MWSYRSWILWSESVENMEVARPNLENMSCLVSQNPERLSEWEKRTDMKPPAKNVLTFWLRNLSLCNIFSLGQNLTDKTGFLCCSKTFRGQWQSIHVGQYRMISELPWTIFSREQSVTLLFALGKRIVQSPYLIDEHGLFIGYIHPFQCRDLTGEYPHG